MEPLIIPTKEFNPCAYSKITIKDEDDKERESLLMFDEDDIKNPIDRTSQVFGIMRDDERKNISVTLYKLFTKETFCQGLLLDTGRWMESKNIYSMGFRKFY